jgi:SAM-dependent methyltransferase
MNVRRLCFDMSPGLERELDVHRSDPSITNPTSEIRTRDDVVRWIETNADYIDLQAVAQQVSRGRLLDVGVGSGMTSAYLAIRGFEVTCVEPSYEICVSMEPFFARLGLDISIVCGTGESIGQLQELYDAVVFWSSLHHCDDPLTALRQSHRLLRSNGRVFLFEPVLRFYRSKAWFHRMLVEEPQKVGHYGGNEHVYRYHEYVGYLREAGFGVCSSQPSRKYAIPAKRAPWDNDARWLLKRVYYRAVRHAALGRSPLGRMLLRASILTPLIVGQKNG